MTQASSGFRPDIQILRGVSVLAVLAYHLRPDAAPSGFLGVDLFFVVSGYLMATLYKDITPSGVGEFFRRRAARLIPAYVATVVVTLATGAFILYPQELESARRSAMYAAGLIPNVGFWLHDTYFSPDLVRPLLHLWTIGVEIQFYLIFPLMLWLWRRSRTAVIALVALNLIACLVMTEVSARTSFYLTPFRLWEFGLGFLAAQMLVGRPGVGSGEDWRGWTGLATLATACGLTVVPGLSQHHPGWAALAACLLAAATLSLGLPRVVVESAPGRALAKVGDYSYALYLVHFPLIALGFYVPFAGWEGAQGDSRTWLVVLVLLPLLMLALHYGVERPMRRRTRLPLGHAGLMLAALLGLAGLSRPVMDRIEALRFAPSEQVVLAAWSDRAPIRCGTMGVIPPSSPTCRLATARPGGHTILLVGDSHAESLTPLLARLAHEQGDGLLLHAPACVVGRPNCEPERLVNLARIRGADTILLSGLVTRFDADATEALLVQAAVHGIRVTSVDPHPTLPFDVIAALDAQVRGRTRAPTVTGADYQTTNAEALAALDRLERRGLTRVRVAPALCVPTCTLIDEGGRPLYSDSQHLSQTGIRKLAEPLTIWLASLDSSDDAPPAPE